MGSERFHAVAVPLAWACVAACAAGAAGCGRKAGELFPPPAKPLVWPAAPDAPRIRYVGQLATSADLHPGVGFGQGLGEALFGKGTVYSMLTPYAVCTDGADRLFVSDSNAQVVHVFNLRTREYTRWAPNVPEKRFSQPVGLAFDPATRYLYVADSVAGLIYIFDANGKTVGAFGQGYALRPCGMAMDVRGHRLFVADSEAHQVLIFTPDGRPIDRLGRRGVAPGEFNFPTNVAVDGQGLIYVADSLNFRIQQFGPDLKPIRQIGKKGDSPGYFSQPKGIAVDYEDHLYVIDANFEVVQIFNSQGALLLDFGQEGSGPGQFQLPAGIFIDHKNRIWVGDSYNRRVQVFDYLPEKKP
jgi:streptogramin lyase